MEKWHARLSSGDREVPESRKTDEVDIAGKKIKMLPKCHTSVLSGSESSFKFLPVLLPQPSLFHIIQLSSA